MKISHQDIQMELIALTGQLLIDSGITQTRDIKLNSSLQRHLGIDSLARAELFQRIEKTFGVTMPDQLLAEAETLNDIATYLQLAEVREVKSEKRERLTSHGGPIHLDPSQAKTLIDVLRLYGENAPDKPHVYFQKDDGSEEIITYGQLLNRSLRVAHGLQARGLMAGDTVAIMQPTTPLFFYTFFGALLAGGIPVPIYPPFRAHMLEAYAKTEARILQSAEVRMLVTFDQAEKLSHLLQAFVPSLKVVTTAVELLVPDEIAAPFSATQNHSAFIQYTSGSTNDPKGVLLTHYNLLSNIRAYGKAIQVKPDDVTVSWLPLYHDFGLIGAWLGSFYHGVPLILMTPFTFLNHPERWLWAIHYHRGTITGAPNFAFELCVRKIDPAVLEGLDLSSWRIAANGAEKVYPRTLEQFAEKFAPYGFKRSAILPVYGLAESTVCLAIPPLDQEFHVDEVDRKQFEEERLAMPATEGNTLQFVDCGRPLENHAIRVVDEDGNELPERCVGKLQFKGPSAMQGYFNNPLATQAIYHEGGWWDTGDLAYIADKSLYITGRNKDLIIKAGRNLYPVEIEELVGRVSGVRQGCVVAFGLTDVKRGTEQLIVVAETHERESALREDIIMRINHEISSVLDIVPDQVVLVAPRTVPKTSSGKLQRAACKTLYQEGLLNKTKMPAWAQVVKLATHGLWRKCVSMLRSMGKLLYTMYVALYVVITLIPIYLIVLVASPAVSANVCRYWAKSIMLISLCSIKEMGAENLTKASPVIFVANHASYIDALLMAALLPAGTRFVGKKELLSVPIIRTLMRKLNFLSVDRLNLTQSMEDAKQMGGALKTGHSILIFPEGTFGYASGLRPFRMGAFKIAAEAQVPVCPIAVMGTRFVLRATEWLMEPGRIRVTIGTPIEPKGTEWSEIAALRDAARKEIAAHCGEPSLDFIAAQTVASNDRE